MALDSATSRVDYTGNGAVDTYPYTFRIFEETDLQVTVRDDEDVETELELTTDYTVSGVGDEGGGNVVLVDDAQDWIDSDGDLRSGYVLTIRRIRPLTQETEIRNQGSYYAASHENAFDHFIMVDQQQQDEIDRTFKLPVTLDPDDVSTEVPIPEAGKGLRWNSDGDALENYDAVTGISSSDTETISNNQSSAADIDDLTLDSDSGRGAIIEYDISRKTDTSDSEVRAIGVFRAVYRPNKASDPGWYGEDERNFDDVGVTLSVTVDGQIQYTSTNISGTNHDGSIKYTKRYL